MNTSQAVALAAKLFAAFPYRSEVDPLTVEVYAEWIAKAPDAAVAEQTINELIESCKFLPSIAEYRETYIAVRSRQPVRLALDAHTFTEEEMAANRRRFVQMFRLYEQGGHDFGEMARRLDAGEDIDVVLGEQT